MTTIGIAQWHPQCGKADTNLRDALRYIETLAERGADLVVLPELWPCGYDPETLAADADAAAEPLDGPRGQLLADAARVHGIWLFAGTVPERSGGSLHNTAVVYGPDGVLRAAHRKVHLYHPLGEDDVFSPGDDATVLEVDGVGTVGISICFDGDHPGYARRLLDLGAHMVVAPCAYEWAARSWWDILYPANALLNGQWWVMANQAGGDLLGGSRILAPDGSVHTETLRTERVDQATPAQLLVTTVDVAAGVIAAGQSAGALWKSPVRRA